MSKYKKGSSVIILSGKDKGKSGVIEKVFPKESKILVENINVVKKHIKPTKEAEGGIKELSLPFPWSKAKVVGGEQKTRSEFSKSDVAKKAKTTKSTKK